MLYHNIDTHMSVSAKIPLIYNLPDKNFFGELKFIQILQFGKLLDTSKFILKLVVERQLELKVKRFTDFF